MTQLFHKSHFWVNIYDYAWEGIILWILFQGSQIPANWREVIFLFNILLFLFNIHYIFIKMKIHAGKAYVQRWIYSLKIKFLGKYLWRSTHAWKYIAHSFQCIQLWSDICEHVLTYCLDLYGETIFSQMYVNTLKTKCMMLFSQKSSSRWHMQ